MLFRWIYYLALIFFVFVLWGSVRWLLDPPPQLQGEMARQRIVQIMNELYDGDDGIHSRIGDQLQQGINWPELQSLLNEYLGLAQELHKVAPPIGNFSDWRRLNQHFMESIETLAKLTQSRETEKVRMQFRSLREFCSKCHAAHRP